MGKQLFGTDGIRGVAGQYPLDPPTIHAFGNALGTDLVRRHQACEVVIGMDTRESGTWIAEQVAGGLEEKGVRSRLAGVITTPGIAYLTSNNPFAAGLANSGIRTSPISENIEDIRKWARARMTSRMNRVHIFQMVEEVERDTPTP